ncbi:MAG: thiamine diphosphokinase [Ignavibacteriae bacterium]|nr:thiamine diphosphokinase [Ignavibacteriota bacterium]
MEKCLILANGQYPNKKEILYLKKNGFDKIICADGGANSAFKLNIIPDLIIGDLDSIEEHILNYYEPKTKIKKIKRQNDTDVEKALKYAISKNCREVILLGATGDRLDHSFCNLGIALKFDDKIKINVLHQKSYLSVKTGTVNLKTIPKEIISLYGFDSKTKITSKGLKYELTDEALPFGKRESTSNQAVGTEVNLKIKGGKIFIIREFEALKKNDFFKHT